MLYVIIGACMAGAVAYFRWRERRKEPEDRSEIEHFARSRTLRIISVQHSSAFSYWLRGVFVGIGARIYTVIVEDSEEERGEVGVAFGFRTVTFNSWFESTSLFESGPLEILKPYGLTLVPQGQAVNLKQVVSVVPPPWRWYERLSFAVLGACISGFAFLSGMRDLAYPERPKVPDITHGYTYLLSSARYGPVYVTHFEHWAGTYGSKLSLACAFVVGLSITCALKIKRTGTTCLLQVSAAGLICYLLYGVLWRVF